MLFFIWHMPVKLSRKITSWTETKMKKLKIVTLGGGSSYTPELIEGFIRRYDELPVTDYYLVDIDAGGEAENCRGTGKTHGEKIRITDDGSPHYQPQRSIV